MLCPLRAPRHAYVAPQLKQAKRIAWDYLQYYTDPIPGREYNQTELKVKLPHGGEIQLYGADNPDALRGGYLDGCVLDEYAQMPPSVWTQVIRPQLSDRLGFARFLGTPAGKNAFYDMWRYAQKTDGWYAAMFKASDTGIIPPEELAEAKRTMGPDEYEQEFECSFEAGIRGTYYSDLLASLEERGHIVPVPHEPAYPVDTWWDLGVADETAIWFSQWIHGARRFIDYYEQSGEGLDYYAQVLRDKRYRYHDHIAPHDIMVRELGSGKSRFEVAANYGIHFRVAPKWPVQDGINAVRLTLPNVYFDVDKCARGVEGLRQYRKEWDEKMQIFRARPRHDWTSHPADAFRTGCQAAEAKDEEDSRPAFAEANYNPLG